MLAGARPRIVAALSEHRRELSGLVAAASALLSSHRHADAATAIQIAANHAVLWHAGLFTDPALERTLHDLGRSALACTAHRRGRSDARRVVHVATSVAPVGGHSRMIWRWIERDRDSRHGLVLTRQFDPPPPPVREAVAASGGQLVLLNRTPGSLLAWARELQRTFLDADLVVLHTHNMDPIPFLALAGMRDRPRVALLNHADHAFWLGTSFVDAVVSTRRSGHRLAAERRGIDPERNLLLPLCLDYALDVPGRDAARRRLGISDDRLVLLTVARRGKFQPHFGLGVAGMLRPLLQSDPRLVYLAVGAGPDFADQVGLGDLAGQVIGISETPDTADMLSAADIYLDTFPFASNTSLFEAGLHGLPLVSRHAFGDEAAVLGADSLGIDKSIFRAATEQEAVEIVRRLASDTAARAAAGTRTRAEILETNTGAAWDQAIAACYRAIEALPPRVDPVFAADPPGAAGDLDILIHLIFGRKAGSPRERRQQATDMDLPAFPVSWKLRNLGKISGGPRVGWNVLRSLKPEWLACWRHDRLTIGRANP